MFTIFSLENLKGRGHSEDQGRDEKINIRLGLREIGWGGVDCIYLAQDRVHWWALVNAVIDLWVP
jgi:hypothetical protein